MTWQAWVLGALAMLSTWVAIYQTFRLINTAKAGLRAVESERAAWQQLEEIRDKAAAFQNSCRLITITRNGRMNIFTFQRNSDIFTIETMGMLADTPDDWRQQAGLYVATKPEKT